MPLILLIIYFFRYHNVQLQNANFSIHVIYDMNTLHSFIVMVIHTLPFIHTMVIHTMVIVHTLPFL